MTTENVERGPYPEIEPYEHGMLDVGDGNAVYWEACGDPDGKPALVLHGGPGVGCSPAQRRLFDPSRYRIVLFDQRGCGRSTPHASGDDIDMGVNTTWHLVSDIERLREHLGIDRWLILGGSWGTCLGLAYAEKYRERVSELVLTGVFTSRRSELDWLYGGGAAPLFPEQWAHFVDALPPDRRDGDLIEAYADLLDDPAPRVRERARSSWLAWEAATMSVGPDETFDELFDDPAAALAYVRIVVHYFRHLAWLEENALLDEATALHGIPGVIVQGRYDVMTPTVTAWELQRCWPDAELVVVEDAGHSVHAPGMYSQLIHATERFSRAARS